MKKTIVGSMVMALFVVAGCTTTRTIAHDGLRRDYFSRYVSDTNDSVQQLALYEKSMTFELLLLEKTTSSPRPVMLYYYGYYMLDEENGIVFYIYAKDPRLLKLLEDASTDRGAPGGPVIQRYDIDTFSGTVIRLRSTLDHPLFHLFFGPIEGGKPPTIFTEV
ncbi:MAG: hypothetical protein JXQ30_06345 [Spirochaetes bacterium]|nr:hypothetical protein [Spirochaetota bacterium]